MGVIGTGIGVRSIVPAFARTPAVVTALCGRTRQRTREIGESLGIPFTTSSVEELCGREDLDIICIASPNQFHVDHVRIAADSGATLHIEKPAGRDLADASAIRASTSAGKLVVVGYQLRFNPHVRAVRNAIRAGLIGRPYQVLIQQASAPFTRTDMPWSWHFEPMHGGARLAMGSHLVDLAEFLLGAKTRSVAATADPVRLRRSADDGELRRVVASSFFSAELTLVNGTAVQLSTTLAAHGPSRFDLTLAGEDGEIRFGLGVGALLYRLGRDPVPLVDDPEAADFETRPGSSIFSRSFTYLAEELVRATINGASSIVDAATVDDAVNTMRVLDAARVSYSDGGRELLSPWQPLPWT